MERNKLPAGLVVFNYAKSKAKLPAESDVPTLLPENAMSALLGSDTAPYYKIEAIEYPANGTGGVYEKSFFKSFLSNLKSRPYPGSKRGHEYTSRPSSDFYTVGGKMVDNEDGKTGTIYLKIYIPPVGDTTDNAGFIRDAKAGIVNFSLVTAPEYRTEQDEKGNTVYYYTASMGYERNDAVEYGAGAMEQVVNSASIGFDVEKAKELVSSGQVDRNNTVSDVIHNGKVYRSSLRRLVSRATGINKTVISELISEIDKQKNGGKPVDKEEILSALKNMAADAKISLKEVAENMGLGDRLRNEQDGKNAELVKELNGLGLGDKPIDAVKALQNQVKENAVLAVENAVVALVGPAKEKNAEGKDEVNPSYQYAMLKCSGLAGDALKNALSALANDPVMVSIRGNMADSGIKIVAGKNGNAEQHEIAAY